MIEGTCPGCARVFKVADEYAGKKAKCPKCSTIFVIGPPPAAARTASAGTPTPTNVPAGGETAHRRVTAVPTGGSADPAEWSKTELTVPEGKYRAGTRVFEFRKGGRVVRVPARVGGRYPIDGILASGGMGAILKARDERLGGRPVLIKMGLLDHANLFPDHQRPKHRIDRDVEDHRLRLEDEMNNLLRLVAIVDDRIPAVCHFVHDYSAQLHGPHGPTGWYWEKDDRIDVADLLEGEPYLVLRHIEGANLKDLLQARSPDLGAERSVERARVCFDLARELCGLLMQFHRRRAPEEEEGDAEGPAEDTAQYYVYQDLKPDNIVRTPMGDHFLIDFGTVRDVIVKDGQHDFGYNPDHTEGYSAPEIRDYEVSELSDLYSFGATLYHVVTGRQPRAADLRPEVAAARKSHPEEIYGGLLELIDRCVRPDPRERREALLGLAEREEDRARLLPVEVVRHFVIREGGGI